MIDHDTSDKLVIRVVRMPQHPHHDIEVLAEFSETSAAQQYIDGLTESEAEPEK